MLDEFTHTPERDRILRLLKQAQRDLHLAAQLLRREAAGDARAEEVLSVAQQVASQKSLLAQDWSLRDAEAPGHPLT
jgi:hypothetical protein